MQQAELGHLRQVLLGFLEEIKRPQERRELIAVENVPDTIDRVQNAAERELAIRQIESDFLRLQKIRLALERIEDGTYGTCIRCECEIGSKRLNAVPWASCCVKCQDIADRESQQPDSEGVLTF
jgi:DnaK suppressor protein